MATAPKIPSLDVTKSQKGFQVGFQSPRSCSCLGRPCRLDDGTCFEDSARRCLLQICFSFISEWNHLDMA